MPALLPSLDAFQKERGKLVDAFALVETRIIQAIARGGGQVKNDTLGAKVKTLQSLCPNPKTLTSLSRVTSLAELRAHIVHGTLALTDYEDRRFAVFRNAKYAANPFEASFLITLENMRKLTSELGQVAKDLTV